MIKYGYFSILQYGTGITYRPKTKEISLSVFFTIIHVT